MKNPVLLLLASVLSVSSVTAEEGFTPLFNGSSLENWDGNAKFWSVQDGAITGQTTAENPTQGNTFLIYRQPVSSDFELRAEYRIVGGNSGIQYRSFETAEKWVVGGYQGDIDSTDVWSGTNYGERFRGILAKRGERTVIDAEGKPTVIGMLGDPRDLQKQIKNEDWNSYRIVAQDNRFKHWINDVLMSAVTDEDGSSRRFDGLIALQLHAGPPMKVQFRNIRISAGGEATAAVTSASPSANEVKNNSKQGFLGIQMSGTTVAGPNGGRRAAIIVMEVIADFAAAKSGLKPEDLILAIDGKGFRDGANAILDFRKAIISKAAGSEVELTYRRGDQEKVVKVRLDPRPAEFSVPATPLEDEPGYLGVQMAEASILGADGAQKPAALVSNVVPNSPAQEAGLAKGDLIFAVDGKGLSVVTQGVREIQKTISEKKAGQAVELDFHRNDQDRRVKVTLATRPPELRDPPVDRPPDILDPLLNAPPTANSREAKDAVAQLEVAAGLEATLFASEPMILSPSNIDIDHRGRVWVAEIVNYRGHNGKRPEGDRILILEDTNGDGQADSSKTFYQKPDFVSPHGICVLGNKVIVSLNMEILVFTDENGDDQPDKVERMFQGEGSKQHDHTLHAFVFGPDGKLYFNHGNEVKRLKDKNGQPVIDRDGVEVAQHRKPYQEGMIFRCDLDGSNLETLAWNFRNNWEVAVDSFGSLWQSDNDDDGNQGVRINYVMEFGNYGRNEEMTGAGWQQKRTNMEKETPLRHWHLNDPGVVPNLLQTGAGSPTGITVYEGDLLPAVFHGQMIHCDPGPNVCRAYPVANDGAGYKAEMLNILAGARDNWFRPVDPCVAPDGSLLVADWYDPGVGGHAMGDLQRGRIFRVAPPGKKYETAKFDFTTADGAVEALKSPNQATRYLAWTALHKMGHDAEGALEKLWQSSNPRHRARALWLLGKIPDHAEGYVGGAIKDADPNIRITGLRLARQSKMDWLATVGQLVNDPSPQVRRECAIALRHNSDPRAAELWVALASQHDGKDRWYLEALGIGADKQWDAFLGTWLAKNPDGWKSPAGRDLIWRSRGESALEYLVKIIKEGGITAAEQPRYIRAFDFHQGPKKDAALLKLLE